MISLGNAFDDEELRDWQARIARQVGTDADGGYSAELKIDGTAVSLTYEKGVLVDGRDARQRDHRRDRDARTSARCATSRCVSRERIPRELWRFGASAICRSTRSSS